MILFRITRKSRELLEVSATDSITDNGARLRGPDAPSLWSLAPYKLLRARTHAHTHTNTNTHTHTI
jgi:hypothetical protein